MKTIWIVAVKDTHKFVGAFEHEHSAVEAKESLEKLDPSKLLEVFWVYLQ